jgi:hypothetical protein
MILRKWFYENPVMVVSNYPQKFAIFFVHNGNVVLTDGKSIQTLHIATLLMNRFSHCSSSFQLESGVDIQLFWNQRRADFRFRAC